MTNAKKTIELSIINGLSKNAHITKITADKGEIITKDIIDALFHPSVIWSVKKYINEIEKK